MKKTIWVIQGPNLNLLGEREEELYGKITYPELRRDLNNHVENYDLELRHHQSNHEGQLIDRLQHIREHTAAVIINAGGLTHTSVSLRDAISSIKIPVIEVHLTDISQRESFRRKSLLSDVCTRTFMGEGKKSYLNALNYLIKELGISKLETASGKKDEAGAERRTFIYPERIWFEDTDAAGILFNANIFRTCHRVLERYLEDIELSIPTILNEREWKLPIVNIEASFLRPLRAGKNVEIEIKLVKQGEKSFKVEFYVMSTNGRMYANASMTMVTIDKDGKSISLPEELIRKLQ